MPFDQNSCSVNSKWIKKLKKMAVVFYCWIIWQVLERLLLWNIHQWMCKCGLICCCPHYVFNLFSDYRLYHLDWCGLVVCLPWGLSLVRRFDLSGQTKYFFILFKGANQNNKSKTTHIQRKRKEEKKKKKKRRKKGEKKNDHV